jgi:hypothetical protein
LPLAQPIGSGWMPVIYHPARIAEYLRFERFPRKAKATGEEALAYAARVLWWRNRREREKRRRLEILQGNLLRQTKLSPGEAMAVAERVWRRWPAEKRRKIEALSSAHYAAWLEAAE